MRARSTLIVTLALLLSGCGLEPQIKPSDKAQLENLKGPEVGSIQGTLEAQAEEAENAGDFSRAAETYKQLIDKSPNNKDYMLAFANDLRRSGDSDAALMLEEKLLKKDPENAAVLEGKGLSLMNKGEFKEAGNVFGEVMKIDPKRWRTLNGIGILFAMKSRNSDALAYYNEALNLKENNPSVLNNMGLTLAMDKQYDKAFEAFVRAKRHLPDNSPEIRSIDLNMALVYAIAGKLDEAERTAAPHLSKAGLYNNMGFYAYLAKNNDLAKGYLNMALTQSPVYYERAWKNLNAMSGENGSGTNDSSEQNTLKEDKPGDKKTNDKHVLEQSSGVKSKPGAVSSDEADDKPAPKVPSKPEDKTETAAPKGEDPKPAPSAEPATKLDDIPGPKPVPLDSSAAGNNQKKDAPEEKPKEDMN